MHDGLRGTGAGLAEREVDCILFSFELGLLSWLDLDVGELGYTCGEVH